MTNLKTLFDAMKTNDSATLDGHGQYVAGMTAEIARTQQQIEALQNIQKQLPPSSTAWQGASERLAPLFAKMAEWQRSGALNG